MATEVHESIDTTQAEMTYIDALFQGHIEEFERDDRVILIGENPEIYGSVRLLEEFGSRVWSTPISEGGFTGVGIGAAITGLRPIVDLTIASFVYLASDQIINQAAKLRYMTGGQIRVPIVFRVGLYYGDAHAAQHSDRPYPMFMNVPGLKIVAPTTPADAKGLLKSAVRDDDPVMFFEDVSLWSTKGQVPTDREYLVPLGRAHVRHRGDDVTIVAIAGAMGPAEQATAALAGEGISVELIDLRSLRPLDTTTILESVAKTGRLIVVENAHRVAGAGSEIAAVVCEEAFDSLRRPIVRLAAPDVHVPFSPALEKGFYPGCESIIAAVKKLL
jgi:acetoin:2,6-dichlorophenolindophenol oxidoreductase subunit beta